MGRLDQDTEGLLILTNVGDLNHRITHPSFEIEKEYEAIVEGSPSKGALDRIEAGVMIESRKTAPAKITDVERRQRETRVRLVIHEGRKRQVRRMFSVIGHEVRELRRLRVGGVHLGSLARGD